MTIKQLPAHLAAQYRQTHDALTVIAGQARRGGYSRFTVTNRHILQTARQYLNAIENRDGDELVAALAKAQTWVDARVS